MHHFQIMHSILNSSAKCLSICQTGTKLNLLELWDFSPQKSWQYDKSKLLRIILWPGDASQLPAASRR